MITKSVVNWFLQALASLLEVLNPPSTITAGIASALDVDQAGNWIGIIDPFVPVSSIVGALNAGLAVMGFMMLIFLFRMVMSYVTGGGGSV